MLAHAAYRMGEVAAENALRGNHRKANLTYTPAAVYTHPEVAMVGMTEEAAREQYGDILIGNQASQAMGELLRLMKLKDLSKSSLIASIMKSLECISLAPQQQSLLMKRQPLWKMN